MTLHYVRATGVPAWVPMPFDEAQGLLCVLHVRHSRDKKQAVITLGLSVPVDGMESDPSFTLVYNADIMVPDKTSLSSSTNIAPPNLSKIARGGSPAPHLLSLVLSQSCPVKCSKELRKTPLPKRGSASTFYQFVKLAVATEVNIYFDYKWVPKGQKTAFRQFILGVGERKGLDEVPPEAYWLADSLAKGPAFDPALDFPPAYDSEIAKRPLEISTPERASNKRVCLSPALSPSGSVTEEDPVTSDTYTAITSLLPQILRSIGLPELVNSTVQSSVDSSLPALVDSSVVLHLPCMLSRILEATPTPSQSSQSSQAQPQAHLSSPETPLRHPKHDANMSTLRKLTGKRLSTYAGAQLNEIYDTTLDHAYSMRNAADMDFTEICDDLRLDLTIARDEGVHDLNREATSKLESFQNNLDSALDDLQSRADKVVADTEDRLMELEKKAEGRVADMEKRAEQTLVKIQMRTERRLRELEEMGRMRDEEQRVEEQRREWQEVRCHSRLQRRKSI